MKQSVFEKIKKAHFPETQVFRLDFNSGTCTNCGLCVQACPTSCLQWDVINKIPYGTSLGELELACIGCNNCEAICPSQSIKVRGEYRVLAGRYMTPEDQFGEITFPEPIKDTTSLEDNSNIPTELTETEKVIYNRRSIRMFKDKPVPKELVHRIIEAARFAPSAGNGQPWKFIVVTDRELSNKIDEASAKILTMILWLYNGKQFWRKLFVSILSFFQINKWDQRPVAAMNKIKQMKKKKGRITFNAPVVIHILKDKRGISNPDVDVAIAAQNLVLTAHSLGLGTCYIGFLASTYKYAPAIKKMLGFGYPYELVTSVCVGYPKVREHNKPVPRRPVSLEWIE